MARQDAALPDRASLRTLAKIEEWAQVTRTGDLAELPGLDERSALIPWVTSTRDNCLGAQCPKFRACHVNLARREALAADVVVINHHLFFADLAVRESGMAELLPTVRVAILTRPTSSMRPVCNSLGAHVTDRQLLDFARDMLGADCSSRAAGRLEAVASAAGARRPATCGSWWAGTAPGARCAGSARRPGRWMPAAWRQALTIWPRLVPG
jgi:ATP-dependent DNA helicase DinG